MAIAFDNCTSVQAASASSLTYAKTNTGSDIYLTSFASASSDVITGITYDSVPETLAVKRAGPASSEIYAFTLAGPSTGAHNVVVTASGSTNLRSCSSSYTGAQSSTTPDATGSDDVVTAGGDANLSITTTVANCWLVATNGDSLLDPTGAASGSTIRNGATTDTSCFDSGPHAAAGAHDVGLAFAGPNVMSAVGVSIAPVSTTAIKTINDLAKASNKTKNGLAIASVKTINGLA